MKCLKCNAPIAEGTFFCEGCKTKPENYKVCSKCKNKIPKDVLFCPQCGSTSFSKEEEASVEEYAFEEEVVNIAPKMEPSEESAPPKEDAPKPEPEADPDEELEKTMAIPVIKPGIRYGSMAPYKDNPPAHRYGGGVPSPGAVPRGGYPAKAPARSHSGVAKPMAEDNRYPDSNDTAKKIIVFIAVFLSVVLVGFSSIFLYMNYFK